MKTNKEEQDDLIKESKRFGESLTDSVSFLISKANQAEIGSEDARKYTFAYQELMCWALECDFLKKYYLENEKARSN